MLARALACLLFVGCSSDAVTAPEPAVDRAGAFVAVDEGTGHLTLHRTLDTFQVEGDTLLLLTVYDVEPRTPDEARAIAQSHDIPVLHPVAATSLAAFPSGPYWVVWYRSLSAEELAVIQ